MPSGLLVSYRATVLALKTNLIVERADYSSYTAEDHDRALGFRVLASAHLEQFVEKRCEAAATTGLDRLSKQQPTRTGRALLAWRCATRRSLNPIPIQDAEYFATEEDIKDLHEAYANLIRRTHGMSGRDLRALVIPLGLQEAAIDELFVSQLADLSLERQAAAHVKVNRARSMTEPIKEWTTLQALDAGLGALDDALTLAATAL